MEGRETVVLLQRFRLCLDLLCVESDLLGIFLGLDRNEAVDRVFDRLGELGERFHFLAIHFADGEISDLVVADRRVGRQHLRQNDDAAIALGIQLRLKPVFVDEPLRRVL